MDAGTVVSRNPESRRRPSRHRVPRSAPAPRPRPQVRPPKLAHPSPHRLAHRRGLEVELTRLGQPSEMAGFALSTKWPVFTRPPSVEKNRTDYGGRIRGLAVQLWARMPDRVHSFHADDRTRHAQGRLSAVPRACHCRDRGEPHAVHDSVNPGTTIHTIGRWEDGTLDIGPLSITLLGVASG